MDYVHRLLVEGTDDEHVFYSLFNHYGIPFTRHGLQTSPNRVSVRNKEGIDPLLDDLDVELDRPGVQALAIVVDADTDIAARWQSLRARLAECGYADTPLGHALDGTIVKQVDKPDVGVWLMLNNNKPGMLEDFVELLLPHTDALWPHAKSSVENIPQHLRLFSNAHNQKAIAHTWLAWQERPGVPFGLAITSRYLKADAEIAQRLIEWVRRLFQLGGAA